MERRTTPALRVLTALTDLVLPADCAVCGAPGHRLCPGCAAALERALSVPRRAEEAALALPLLPAADPGEAGPLPVVAAGRYEGCVAAAVLAFKDHHAVHLRRVLGDALVRAVARARLDPELPGASVARLVPVPGSASGHRRRGYDPLTELTRSLPAAALVPGAVRPALRATTAAHRGAGVRERRARDRRWSAVPGRLSPGEPVLLVDDVLTTGATLGALADAVRRAGARPVGAVVVAAVPPPRARPYSPATTRSAGP